jgi:hypothetical protein
MMNHNNWFRLRRSADAANALEIPPAGDVVIRQPKEG